MAALKQEAEQRQSVEAVAQEQSDSESVIELSERDSALFVSTLRQRPQPSSYLVNALREHHNGK